MKLSALGFVQEHLPMIELRSPLGATSLPPPGRASLAIKLIEETVETMAAERGEG